MPLTGEYEPSPHDYVRKQVEEYESSGGTRGNLQQPTGLPVVIVTCRGHTSGKIRKFPVMRVEHGGEYALIASKGGAPDNPTWTENLRAHPGEVMVQDGPEPFDATVRELDGEERQTWWDRAVEAFAGYAGYEKKTERTIPVFLATRKD
jgi:deazaflavin-dependent oxidoreductase (nitroreductase family)